MYHYNIILISTEQQKQTSIEYLLSAYRLEYQVTKQNLWIQANVANFAHLSDIPNIFMLVLPTLRV